VPTGVVLKDGDVTSVEVSFNVNLDEDILNALNLSATTSNLQIAGSTDHAGLVNITTANPGTIQNDTVTVTFTVTLDEPATQAAYDAIKNGDITFDVTFEATQA